MKKIFKTVAAVLAAVTAMSCTGLSAYADKLKKVDGVTYLYSDSGEKIGKYTGWSKNSKGKRCYKKGVMYTNRWIKTKKGKYYYAGSDGYMRTGWAAVTRGKGSYSFFDKNGVWDGKTYYIGYQPKNLYSFFLDFDFFGESELTIGYSRSGVSASSEESFDDSDILQEILENDLYTETVKDSFNDDEIDRSSELFHEGRCIRINSSADKHAYLEFTKDEDGNSYLYNGYFGFGLKLKDKYAFEKLSEIIDGGEDVEEGLEDDEEDEEEETYTSSDVKQVDSMYSDYCVFDGGVYYVNVTDDSQWSRYTFTKGEYFDEIKYTTHERMLSEIKSGSANILPVGTKLYKTNENPTVILANVNGRLIPYLKIVEG